MFALTESQLDHARILTREDIPLVLKLYESNPLYFYYCPPTPSGVEVWEDMTRLPPGKSSEDKFFLGFWKGRDLVAVMDFVYGYPDKETVFIGLFMVDSSWQDRGVGSRLIVDSLAFFSKKYHKVRLACVKGNPQSENFWKKQGFLLTGEEAQESTYSVYLMEKSLK